MVLEQRPRKEGERISRRTVLAEQLKSWRIVRQPMFVGQFEFVEWTQDAHLRHSRFMGLREDKKAKAVVGEEEKRTKAPFS